MSKKVDPVELVQLERAASVTFDPPIARPNILLVLPDDLGVDVLPTYKAFQESHLGFPASTAWRATVTGIKQLKQRGVVFTNCFVAPLCSPTRAMLMSGRYSSRTGIQTIIREDKLNSSGTKVCTEYSDSEFSSEPTLCDFLKEQGYRTGLFGKWHLSLPTEGMDETGTTWSTYGNYGWTGPTAIGGFDVFRGTFWNNNTDPHPPDPPDNAVYHGYYNYWWYESDAVDLASEPQAVVGTHIVRKSRHRLQDWIQNGGTEPWFAYWPLSACHSSWYDWTANPSGLGVINTAGLPAVDGDGAWIYTGSSYPNTATSIRESVWSAMENIAYELERLEDEVGSEVWGRTVVIFLGDNGSDWNFLDDAKTEFAGPPVSTAIFGTEYGANIDARIQKGKVYSGGVRVPLIISGPNTIVRSWNRFSNAIVDAVDIHATIRRLSRSDLSDAVFDSRGYDGVDLYDIISNVSGADEAHRTWGISERGEYNGSVEDTFFPGGVETTVPYSCAYRKWRDNGDADDGLWVLVRNGGNNAVPYDDTSSDELFKHADDTWAHVDTNEQTDLAATKPGILAELQADLAAFHATSKADQWPTT